AIEMFHKTLINAQVGDNVGLLIKNIKKNQVSRGNLLVKPGSMGVYRFFEGKAYTLTKKEGGRHKPFMSNYKPQFFFRTSNVTGTIVLSEDKPVVMPGDSASFNVTLVNPSPLNMGLKFVMREGTITLGAV